VAFSFYRQNGFLIRLLYEQAVLGIIGDKLKPTLKSGASDVKREVGKGTQTFERETKEWVMHHEIPKLELGVQVTG